MLLVDDGCNAACAHELQRLSKWPDVTLLRHEFNRGKGAAVCTGLRAAPAARLYARRAESMPTASTRSATSAVSSKKRVRIRAA